MSTLIRSRAARILLLATVYFASGKLGLLLAVAPGYATPVWPPSGIALATLLLWPALWPGVWLGSFTINLSIAFDPSSVANLARSLLLAASIGAGATLQAVVASRLIRRAVGPAPALSSEGDVFRFMLLAGPVACAINATWSVAVLLLTGEIAAGALSFSWGTWWIGDAIGALVFAPLVYMWLSPDEQWHARRRAVTVALAVMFAAALLVFAYTTRSESREVRQHFEKDTALVAAAMQRRIDLGVEILHAVAGLFVASEAVQNDEFSRFTTALLQRHGELQVVFWAPRVTAGASTTQLAPTDAFPVRFVDAQAGTPLRRGLDLANNPTVHATLARARDSGASASTPLPQLDGREIPVGMYLVLVPLYDITLPETPSVAQRRTHLRGFAGGVFDIARLAAAALDQNVAQNIAATRMHWQLEDRTFDVRRILYRAAASDSAATTDALGAPVERTIHVADRQWHAQFEPTLGYLADRSHLLAWLVLLGGLVLTVLVGAGALILTGRTMTIKAEVQSRTEELAQINAKLAEEVCDHIRTEEMLDREREFLKAVLDNLNEGLMVVNSENRVTMANRAAHMILLRIAGTAAALDRGWDVPMETYRADGVTPIARAELPRMRALHGETVRDFEIVIACAQRARVRLLITAQPLLSHDKHQHGAIAVLRDMTEAHKVEQLKREFVATVSHELRTPLTSIRGSLGLLSSGAMGQMTDKVRQLIDMAARNTDRLSFLINDLLDIEKIEQGGMQFDVSEQSLGALVEQAVEAQQGYAHSRGLRLRVQGPANGPSVHVDPQRLLQVLANLLSNATKFSPPGTEVMVRWNYDRHTCRVAITDQGPGIAAEFRGRIFQKFSQADSSDARAKGGTGLGLAISKALIERMGGSIGYDSEPGMGATFYFELPLVDEGPATTRM